jgi:hypothetical protein
MPSTEHSPKLSPWVRLAPRRCSPIGLLWAYREGDANMRSAWVCTPNDVLGSLVATRSPRRFWHGQRLVGRDRSRCHGWTRLTGCVDRTSPRDVVHLISWLHADVRFGSLADIGQPIRDVRFAPESGHVQRRTRCLLCAISRLVMAVFYPQRTVRHLADYVHLPRVSSEQCSPDRR